MKTAHHRLKHPGTLLSALALAALPLLGGCAPGDGGADSGDATADSVARAILAEVAKTPPPTSTSPRLSPQGQAGQPLDVASMGYDRGEASAPVKVMEVSDFGCGYCRRFHEETFPLLDEVYVRAGLVEWKFIPFVLGAFSNGLEAALAGECAGEQDGFFTMQGRLFREQSGWKNSDDPNPFFIAMAEEEGLDAQRFATCLANGWREGNVRANVRLGREMGVRGTPTFIVDGRPVSGAVPYDTFRDILDMALIQRGLTPPEREE